MILTIQSKGNAQTIVDLFNAIVAGEETEHQAQVQRYLKERQDLKNKLDTSDQEKLTLSIRFTSLEKELENCKTQLNKVQLGEVMNILHFVYLLFIFHFKFSKPTIHKPGT